MIKSRRIKAAALALASILLVCSCNKYEEIPELVEPIAGTETLRPVSKRDVGIPKILVACVAPEEYCHFFKKQVKIKKINVELGQFVNEGDVLAEADTDSVKTMISDINGKLDLLNVEKDQKAIIHESTLKELELNKKWTEYMKNLGYAKEEDVEAAEKSIETENENYDYDLKMYDFMKKNYNEELSDLNEIVNDGTLKAKCSGYVTYVKNLKGGHDAGVYENIVVVSDYEDLYLRSDISTQSYQYSRYDAKFLLYDGKMTEISEYDYSDSEKAYAKAQSDYPVIRFKPVEDVEMKLGEQCYLFFYKEYAKDVLAIGKDSAQSDDEGSFVYVQNADGSLEKRYYEPGITDNYYIEIKSGLSEGEMVLYEQTAPLPSKDETIEVERSDYRLFSQVKGLKHEEKKAETYLSEESGEVDTIYVKKGDEVKKGDPLMRIAIDSDMGDNVKIQNDITHLKDSYSNECKEYNKELEELEKQIREKTEQINNLSSQLEDVKKKIDSGTLSDEELGKNLNRKFELEFTINGLYNLSSPYEGYGTLALEEEKTILEANRVVSEKSYNVELAALQNKLKDQKKKNDGSGYKTITATEDGIVDSVKFSEHDPVKTGDKLVEVCSFYDEYFYDLKDKSSLPVGFEPVLAGEDRDYDCRVVKGNWDTCPNIFTEKDKVYCTKSLEQNSRYVIEIDDEEFSNVILDDYTADIETLRIEDVIIVPASFVQSEINFEGVESYFVWKLEDGKYVKEFVVRQDGANSYLILQGLSEGDILAR